MMDYDYTHHKSITVLSVFVVPSVSYFSSTEIRIYIKPKLKNENISFCRRGHLSTVLFICLVLHVNLYIIQEACLKPSRRIFALYLLQYLSLVIVPSVVFVRNFHCIFGFTFCKHVNNMATPILPWLIHRTEYVTHLFLIFTNLIFKYEASLAISLGILRAC